MSTTPLNDYNNDVSGWMQGTTRQMKNRVLRLVMSGVGPSSKQLSGSTKKYAGEANKIVFSFPYYMVFFEKGAGRGYGGTKSGKFTTRTGGKRATSLTSFGKMGTGARQPKPWFNPVVEERFPELLDIVANYRGRKIILNIQRLLID